MTHARDLDLIITRNSKRLVRCMHDVTTVGLYNLKGELPDDHRVINYVETKHVVLKQYQKA